VNLIAILIPSKKTEESSYSTNLEIRKITLQKKIFYQRGGKPRTGVQKNQTQIKNSEIKTLLQELMFLNQPFRLLQCRYESRTDKNRIFKMKIHLYVLIN
jgi:hypothetical protein